MLTLPADFRRLILAFHKSNTLVTRHPTTQKAGNPDRPRAREGNSETPTVKRTTPAKPAEISYPPKQFLILILIFFLIPAPAPKQKARQKTAAPQNQTGRPSYFFNFSSSAMNAFGPPFM